MSEYQYRQADITSRLDAEANEYGAELAELRSENKRLREALRKIAYDYSGLQSGKTSTDVLMDKEYLAEKALQPQPPEVKE